MDINEFKAAAITVTVPGMDGVDRMLLYLQRLVQQGTHDSVVKYQFVDQAMDLLETLSLEDLPQTPQHKDAKYGNFNVEVGGKLYTNRLAFVKALKRPNIFELRINLRDFNWRFRATFFPRIYDGKLYYCLVDPFEKITGNNPTDQKRDHTYLVSQSLDDEEFESYID